MIFEGKSDGEWIDIFIDEILGAVKELKDKALFTDKVLKHLDLSKNEKDIMISKNLHMLLYSKWVAIIQQIVVFLNTDTAEIETLNKEKLL